MSIMLRTKKSGKSTGGDGGSKIQKKIKQEDKNIVLRKKAENVKKNTEYNTLPKIENGYESENGSIGPSIRNKKLQKTVDIEKNIKTS